ncbi:response regulator transcription factor [Streptomyces sp. NPDC057702]|uniref:response regulator transcription factor n=1 Tax=unclassified Streptomyces TaxID=2593676 RepID=UPI00367AEB95
MATSSPTGHTELSRPDGTPVRVLVVEEEAPLAELLAMALRSERWEVRTTGGGDQAVRAARAFRPDAAVLDLTPPGARARALLAGLRREVPGVPVLFLTAGQPEQERVAGLTAGSDAYLAKPFGVEEVIAGLRGLLRRGVAPAARPGSLLTVGDLTLNEDSHEVTRAGVSIRLTATEFELLRFLMRNPRRVLSKAQILDRVWSYDFGGRPNVVELYISYLRRKIDTGRPRMIHTRRGMGYLIKEADAVAPVAGSASPPVGAAARARG